MTEEEKKAIEDLKDILKYWQTIVEIEDDVEREIEMNCYSEEMPFEQLKTALNLIEKNAKEIKYVRKKNKELVEQRSTLQWEYEELQDAFNHYKSISIRKDNVVEKDKVMKVIDYFEQGMQKECNGYIEVKYPFEVSYSGKVAKILRKKLLEEEQK